MTIKKTQASQKTRNQVVLEFTREEDVKLITMLKAMAYERRYPLPTFLILSLHDAFGHLMPSEQTDAQVPPFQQAPVTSSTVEVDTPHVDHHMPTVALEIPQTPVPYVERSVPNPAPQIPPARLVGGKELAELVANPQELRPIALN